jgi:hypothetical protein
VNRKAVSATMIESTNQVVMLSVDSSRIELGSFIAFSGSYPVAKVYYKEYGSGPSPMTAADAVYTSTYSSIYIGGAIAYDFLISKIDLTLGLFGFNFQTSTPGSSLLKTIGAIDNYEGGLTNN